MALSKVVCAKALPAELTAEFLPDAEVVQGPADHEWSREELLPRLAEAEVLVSWAFNRIDAELLDHAPRLRLVSLLAMGTDCLDREALAERGIVATHVPGVYAPAVAEVAIGLLLMVSRRLAEAARFVESGGWQRPEPGRFDGPCLRGKTLGLIGLGQIGAGVAAAARGLGMTVVYHDPHRLPVTEEAALGVGYRSFESLLAESDAISLHVPLLPETHHLLDAAAFGKMKPGAFLINTSRGQVVEEQALVAALESGRLAGAGLDVLEHEPTVPAGLRRDNVVILPHMAGGSVESRHEAYVTLLEDVRRFLSGEEPRYVVRS